MKAVIEIRIDISGDDDDDLSHKIAAGTNEIVNPNADLYISNKGGMCFYANQVNFL